LSYAFLFDSCCISLYLVLLSSFSFKRRLNVVNSFKIFVGVLSISCISISNEECRGGEQMNVRFENIAIPYQPRIASLYPAFPSTVLGSLCHWVLISELQWHPKPVFCLFWVTLCIFMSNVDVILYGTCKYTA